MALFGVEWSVRQGSDLLDLHRASHHAGGLFVENLEPKLLSVKSTGTKAGRKVTVRRSVRHEGTARLKLLREGPTRVFTDRRFPLTKGVNTVVLAVPGKVKAGRLRLLVATSDGSGGGRTFFRGVKVGP